MKKRSLPLFALMLALPFAGISQKLVLEKTYEVDKKAKRGYLDEVTVNPNDKTTTLSFVTKGGSANKVKYQNYIFDKEYNFIKTEETEEQLYRNKKYKGEKYSVEGITVEPNMLGKMVLRKKLVEYNWSWFNGGYKKKVTLLDKVKPKDEAGNSYSLLKKFENDQTGEVIALTMVVAKNSNVNELFLMKIDKDLNMTIVDKNTFATPKFLTASFLIPKEQVNEDEDENTEDISQSDVCFIFAGQENKKNKEEANMFEMWRVSTEGKILSKTEFKTPNPAWSIESIIPNGNSLYLIGPANEERSSKSADETKWKWYQVAKITGTKADYVTSTNIDEFEEKLKKPASQKKNPAYKGKRFRMSTASVAGDGSLFICGQNFKPTDKGREYQDVLMFYFDNMGKLKADYGVRLEERNSDSKYNRTNQYIDFTNSGAYWTVVEMDGFKKESGEDKPKALIYPNIAKIDLKTGEIGEFASFGTVKDKPTYYLQNDFPFLKNPADGSTIFLGVDKPGKVFWFGKVAFD